MGIPNWISLFRICLVPVFPLALFSELGGARVIAVTVYAVACLSDIVDGYIARRYDMITRLGRVLDPLADKLMGAAVLICVAWLRTADSPPDIIVYGFWWTVAVYLIKEALMGIGAVVMYRKVSDVNPSTFPGKLSITLFFIVCTLMLIFPDLPDAVPFAMILIATASSVYAFIHYLVSYKKRTAG